MLVITLISRSFTIRLVRETGGKLTNWVICRPLEIDMQTRTLARKSQLGEIP